MEYINRASALTPEEEKELEGTIIKLDTLNDVNYKDCVGKVCKSKSSGDFKVLKYNDYYEVEIQLLVMKRL